MWEEEKRQLEELCVECIAPLKDKDALIGLVMLSPKDKNHAYTYEDINFLSSVDSIATIAVKNSTLYGARLSGGPHRRADRPAQPQIFLRDFAGFL